MQHLESTHFGLLLRGSSVRAPLETRFDASPGRPRQPAALRRLGVRSEIFSDFEAREHGHMTRTEQYRLTSGLGLICTRGDTPAGRSPMSGRIRRQADYRVPAGRTDHKGGLW